MKTLVWIMAILLAFSGLVSAQTVRELEFVDAELRDVLRVLAQVAGLNLSIGEAVDGRVTVSWREIEVMEAIEILLWSKGYDFRVRGGTLIVGTPERIRDGFERIETQTFSLRYATPSQLVEHLQVVLPAASLRADDRSRSIIATGYQAELERVQKLLERLDLPLPQVVIEARIQEIQAGALRDLGLEWEISGYLEGGIEGWVGMGLNYRPSLRALELAGKSRTLDRTTITAISGQEASILVGDKILLPVDEVVNGQVIRRMVQVDAGVKLMMRPTVHADGRIEVVVEPEISNLVGWNNQHPQIRSRQAQTTVILEDGETFIIGGLFQREAFESLSRVPILGDLPILGRFFQTKTTDERETEILIFLTPQIIWPKGYEPGR